MVSTGLLIRLWAQPGQEAAVDEFLQGAVPIVDQEAGTTAFFALRLGPSEFGIFNAFPDEAARQAHVTGQAAKALFEVAGTLLAQAPSIEPVEIIGSKLPNAAPTEYQPVG
jgi:quinol monooxygenase YgiN